MGTLFPRAIHGARTAARASLSALAAATAGAVLAAGLSAGSAEAKTPGKSYCFYGKCHRVKTIAETRALIGKDEKISASHYDSCKRDRYNPCGLTSSGAVFDSEAPDNAASPVLPDGTTVLVRSPATGVALVLRINNAGPYWGNRKLDVSRKAAEVLGFAGQGVATLEMRVIAAPTVEEATYKKRRVYEPVPGHIGQFASLDAAQSGAATAYMVAGLASPFAPESVLGAGNPTQVAGVTQSAETVVPTVLAAATPMPWPVVQPVPTAEAVASVQVAEASEVPAAKPVKARSYTERTAARNSRAYRLAAQRDKRIARKVVASSEAASPAKAPKIVTNDGTNDMSVFSRHTYAGIDRIASEEPRRRAGGNEG